jgi:hypothetical protein
LLLLQLEKERYAGWVFPGTYGRALDLESIESFIAFVVDAIRNMIYLLERCYYLHSLYFLHVCLSIKIGFSCKFPLTDRQTLMIAGSSWLESFSWIALLLWMRRT